MVEDNLSRPSADMLDLAHDYGVYVAQLEVRTLKISNAHMWVMAVSILLQ